MKEKKERLTEHDLFLPPLELRAFCRAYALQRHLNTCISNTRLLKHAFELLLLLCSHALYNFFLEFNFSPPPSHLQLRPRWESSRSPISILFPDFFLLVFLVHIVLDEKHGA